MSQEQVLSQLRSMDRDLYLASLFFPDGKRAAVQALYAFAADVRRIPFSVTEPALGEIRLQWWHDTVDGIFHGDKQDHPIAQGLAIAIKEGDIPKHALLNLIKAHQFDLYSDPMPSRQDLEGYLGETYSAVIQMGASILGRDDALECSEASGLAGVAYGLSSLLRNLPHWLARHSLFIPKDNLIARDLTAATLARDENEAATTVLLAEFREHARARLKQARKAAWTIKSDLKPAFLHVALTEPYLDLIAKAGSDLVKKPVDIAQWRKQWILWKAAKTESF